jgi:hypothetical protein
VFHHLWEIRGIAIRKIRVVDGHRKIGGIISGRVPIKFLVEGTSREEKSGQKGENERGANRSGSSEPAEKVDGSVVYKDAQESGELSALSFVKYRELFLCFASLTNGTQPQGAWTNRATQNFRVISSRYEALRTGITSALLKVDLGR